MYIPIIVTSEFNAKVSQNLVVRQWELAYWHVGHLPATKVIEKEAGYVQLFMYQ